MIFWKFLLILGLGCGGYLAKQIMVLNDPTVLDDMNVFDIKEFLNKDLITEGGQDESTLPPMSDAMKRVIQFLEDKFLHPEFVVSTPTPSPLDSQGIDSDGLCKDTVRELPEGAADKIRQWLLEKKPPIIGTIQNAINQGVITADDIYAFIEEDPFIYSQSYISATDGDEQGRPPSTRLSAPETGTFLRTIFRLGFRTPPKIFNEDGNQSEAYPPPPYIYTRTVSVVGPEDYPCLKTASECVPGNLCQNIATPIRVKIVLSNLLTAVYSLKPLYPDKELRPEGDTAFTYVPIDDYSATVTGTVCEQPLIDVDDGDGECAAVYVGSDDTGESGVYGDYQPCNYARAGSPDITNVDVEAQCGDRSDPLGDWIDSLNPSCKITCCKEDCDSGGDHQRHERWAGGPKTWPMSIVGLNRLEGTLTITINNERPIVIDRFVPGMSVLNEDQTIRVTINKILDPIEQAVPKLANTGIIVWNYDTDASPGWVVNQEDVDPDIAVGMAPTKTQLGGDFGWAWINSTLKWCHLYQCYGQDQSRLFSTPAGGDSSDTCVLEDYYTDFDNVPGWATGIFKGTNADGTTFTAGPVPLVESPCQMSHWQNFCSCQYRLMRGLDVSHLSGCTSSDIPVGGFSHCERQIQGGWYFPPDYDMEYPNYKLVTSEQSGATELHLDMASMIRVAPTTDPNDDFSCRFVNYNAHGEPNFKPGPSSAVEFTAQAMEIAIDFSNDVYEYSTYSSSASIDAEGSSCAYNQTGKRGTLSIVVQNIDPDMDGQFRVDVSCTNDGPFTISDGPTPATFDVDVAKNSLAFPPVVHFGVSLESITDSKGNTYTSTTFPPGLRCTAVLRQREASQPFVNSQVIDCYSINVGPDGTNSRGQAIYKDLKDQQSKAPKKNETYYLLLIVFSSVALIIIVTATVLLVKKNKKDNELKAAQSKATNIKQS